MRFVCPRCSHTDERDAAPAACPACGYTLAAAQTVDATLSYDPNATRVYPGGLAAPPRTREEVGGYRLLREIGAGGMGTVYEAEEIATGRRFALKLIRPELAAAPNAVDRLRREGRVAAAVTHPRCVFVVTADEDDGLPYVVMELMPGETLQDLVERAGPLAPAEAVGKMFDVLEGLDALHHRGIVHRDVKPGNCFLEADGRVKVGDFGLAFSLVADREATERVRFAGTPLYASPEQHRGEPLDERTDVYSASATLYFLLTGRQPFEGRDAASLLMRIESGPAPPIRTVRPDMPAGLDRAVLRGLEREPNRRWQSLEAMRRALARYGPARLSAGDLRLRVAAYLIDYAVITAGVLAVGLPIFLLLRLWVPNLNLTTAPEPNFNICSGMATYRPGNALLAAAVDYLYFGVLEGLFGCGLGKRLMGLRVVRFGTTRPPGIPLAMVRAAVFCLLLYLPRYLLGLIDVPCFFGVLCGLMSWWNLGSLALLACTMRPGNGFRGLHDFAAGCAVIRVAWGGKEVRRGGLRRACPDRLAEPLLPPDGWPAVVGPFEVRGVLARLAGGGVALAEDMALRRNVVLWVRPAAEPPLSPARRAASRLTRLRWLADGVQGASRWDAFVAEEGRPLTDLVVEGGRFGWEEARAILHQLTEELAASCVEETVPRPLVPEQAWVRPDGNVFLFDLPPEGAEKLADAQPPAHDWRALNMLAAVIVLALEGKDRPAQQPPTPVRAPLPQYAAGMLSRLVGAGEPYGRVEDFRADLAAALDRPARLPRVRRAAQVALQGAIVAAALFLALTAGDGLRRAFTGLSAVTVGNVKRDGGSVVEDLPFYVLPVIGILWSTLARGGPTYFACGVALVRADGRRAAWWQALLRAFLAWVIGGVALGLVPMVVGMLLDRLMNLGYVPKNALKDSVWWIWLAWVVVFVVPAIWLPRRTVMDWAARTYLVPR